MLVRWRHSKEFFNRLSNLANVHDNQNIKIGFNAIQSFYKAKMYVLKKKKEKATDDFFSVLNNMYNKRMLNYMSSLKFRTSMKYKI